MVWLQLNIAVSRSFSTEKVIIIIFIRQWGKVPLGSNK